MGAKFLIGVDSSEGSQRAVSYAIQRAKETGASLVVAHVIEWSQYSFSTPQENEVRHKRREEELHMAHKKVVDPVVSQIGEQGISVEGVVLHGHVSRGLVALAKNHQVTAIIVGRHGASLFEINVFGSTVSQLVQIADRPVTVVP